ncbi:DEAD/DEAH box helicase [Cronobacter sakazakii]|uniref:DEAD/DEAH box helicase n=1 Tax=Cronobacter sakazakii TaxID=28141 RepID=UPI000975D518|nr:DEAD/DEAH box helicase [Cronobacter sakazakii]
MDLIDKIEKEIVDVCKLSPNIDLRIIEEGLIKIYRLLDDDKNYNQCVRVICHIADKKIKDALVQQLLHDCIIKSRIFMYDDMLELSDISYKPDISPQDIFLKNFYTSSKSDTTLTKPQKEIFNTFQKNRRLIVSAPTSFGKTRIIREIISHNNYRMIVIIMPTVSLLSEVYSDFKQQFESEYTVSKSSKISLDDNKKYIMILTPERMSVLIQENPALSVDFFVMDEIYKVDYKLNDDRFRIFSDILYKLTNSGSDLYLIGPYINDFSQRFREKFDIVMLRFDLEIVQKDFYELDYENGRGIKEIEGNKIRVIGNKYENLLRIALNSKIDGKYLIYRYQKHRVEALAEKFKNEIPQCNFNESLVEYLEKNVSKNWSLIDCLKRGVAFHHGAMPRYIQDLIIDEFNSKNGGVKFLFCTTSLTEGVNSTAKNVVLYDLKIGDGKVIDNLDRRNIEGRAGRFMQHFLGRVFYMEHIERKESEVTNVEIEFIDSNDPDMETLIQINDADVNREHRNKLQKFTAELNNEKIPLSLLKENKFVNLVGQIELIRHLRLDANFEKYHYSSQRPTLDKVESILFVIFDFLFTENNKGRRFRNEMERKILIDLTKFYIYRQPSFSMLLNSNSMKFLSKEENPRIRLTFDLITKYFEFIWPRYLKAFENILNFVANEKSMKPVNMDYFIAILEYGTNQNHEIILRDAGLPKEIVSKVSGIFNGCINYQDIQRVFKNKRREIESKLGSIEIKIMSRYV